MPHYSQHNEDQILDELLATLGLSTGFFVEFGAWDGKYLSNTFALYEKGWAGCYIEGDPRRMEALSRNCPASRVKKVQAFVEPNGPNSLDSILLRNDVERVDVLSIDIDGDDYRVWKGVSTYHASIVVIEFNSTIPFDMRYINPLGQQHGSGALSLAELAERNGYVLVSGTPTNLIFVERELAKRHQIPAVTLQSIQDRVNCSRYFFGYDGTLIRLPSALRERGIEEILVVPWADCPLPQPLPKVFRKYCDRRSALYLVRLLYGTCRSLLRNPLQTLRAARVWRGG